MKYTIAAPTPEAMRCFASSAPAAASTPRAASCSTDSLVRIFSNDLPLLAAARGAALTALDLLPSAKRFLARRMMFGARG